ncbi:restriction endonuclease subunit S [Intrasporangium flavum]|uniref:restriction endonuclease subunit S n=1 Tax=Intrasporangium flavum TaxID=1428657 RepID=UPI0009FAE290|nr:restriction endonuclease subunit S [Intrasporangium flavum]
MTLRTPPEELVRRAEASGHPGLVGKAPHWSRVRLGDVARVVNGAAFQSVYFNRDGVGLPLIRIRDVGTSSVSTWYAGPWEPSHLIARGDLLVGMDGDFRAARWRLGKALLNQRVCRVEVDESRYDPRFLEIVLQGYLNLIWDATSSVTVKHLSSRSISDIPLPYPEMNEQRRIVEILEDHLSRLDAAADSLSKARSRLEALRRSALDAHFGGTEGKVPLGDLLTEISAGKSFGASSSPATADEWGIIKVSAMTWGQFDPGENKAVPADRVDPRFEIRSGDLLVSRANTSEYVGASVLVGDVRPRLLLSDKSLRITPRADVSSEWLWRALQAPSARRQISALATGTKDSMRNISQGSLRRVQVPLHDSRQQATALATFAQVDAATRRLAAQVQAQALRCTALRRALLSAAFEGKLTARTSDDDVVEELTVPADTADFAMSMP